MIHCEILPYHTMSSKDARFFYQLASSAAVCTERIVVYLFTFLMSRLREPLVLVCRMLWLQLH